MTQLYDPYLIFLSGTILGGVFTALLSGSMIKKSGKVDAAVLKSVLYSSIIWIGLSFLGWLLF